MLIFLTKVQVFEREHLTQASRLGEQQKKAQESFQLVPGRTEEAEYF